MRRQYRARPHIPGYVYVLSNHTMPGMVKIGRTINNPARRARQLRTTGVPGTFRVVYSAWSSDCVSAETTVHRLLAGSRVAKDREFFRISENSAAAVVARVCGKRRRPPAITWVLLGLLLAGIAWRVHPQLPIQLQAIMHSAH